jgi:predicted nucleic acid-binding protein
MIVVLDTGIVGMITNPTSANRETIQCNEWLEGLLMRDAEVVLPEIVDYEIRRELLRVDKRKGIERLDEFADSVTYLPLTTAAMKRAAELWAEARKRGRPTADDKALDADVILAAQALIHDGDDLVIATTNVGHLSRYVTAKLWHEIT